MDGGHPMHSPHPAGGAAPEAVLITLLLLGAACGYLLLVRRARRRHPGSGRSVRTALFLAGLALLAVALLPPLAPAAHTDFRGHMVQHLLIGMYAPLALVLAAPVTVLLRALPPAGARRVTALLHSPYARVPAHPAVALALSTGGLLPLYFTPLFDAAMEHPAGHWLLHAHFLLSGCLFAYVIAGPDPAPRRPGVRARLVYLGVAVAVHALVSQAMYGGFFIHVHAPADQVRRGAELMYYGGDIAELLLAAALVSTWRPGPRTATARRRGRRNARRASTVPRRAGGAAGEAPSG
ncbi:cytochrome c oxidase assembly protein [Streptomyces sp. NPDC003697]